MAVLWVDVPVVPVPGPPDLGPMWNGLRRQSHLCRGSCERQPARNDVSNIQMSTSLNMNLELSTKLNKLDPRSGLLDYHAAWFELFLSNARLKR